MSGKGDHRRRQQIKQSEMDLRWELAFGKPNEERKEEILKLLEEFQQGEKK